MRYWWVNQNQTYRAEIRGNFMWSPKANANGARNQFYENMRQVAPGDIVFSFRDTRIQAVGVVTGAAQTAPKPDFGAAGLNWSNEGWFVPVYYCGFESPIRPKDHIAILRPFLPSEYTHLSSPTAIGLAVRVSRQKCRRMAERLDWAHRATVLRRSRRTTTSQAVLTSTRSDDHARSRATLGRRSSEQLVRARRGQGVFRSSVLLAETQCRVTRVSDPKHLRASHIKPWREANDLGEAQRAQRTAAVSPHRSPIRSGLHQLFKRASGFWWSQRREQTSLRQVGH